MHIETDKVTTFQENIVPTGTKLAGLAALAHALSVHAPVRRPSCVSGKHIRGSYRKEDAWTVFDRRYWPGDTFADHLTFALRHEDFDPLILKRVFEAVSPNTMEAFVRAAPSGTTTRRAWYLYETLTDRTLKVSDAPEVAAIDLLDPKTYFTGKPRLSKRHRVRDNLLGTGRFCPVIRRTKALEAFVAREIAKEATQTIGRTGAHLVARAASFMLLADSRASFEIEGVRPPRNRLERWGRAVLQAGKNKLTFEEIIRLQAILIEDTRFVRAGVRARWGVPG